MMHCIVGFQTSLFMLILPCICLIFVLFCKTVQTRVVIYGVHVDNDVLYRGIANQPSHIYSSLYLSIFSFFPYFKK